MSITISCDIEGCKASLVVLDCEDIPSDLYDYEWGSEWVKDDNIDFHTCPKHNKENKL